MPRLSDSMEEGTIVAWLVADGTRVAPGDEIVEIETDKATMAFAADAGGVLRIAADPGATVPPGAPIARIDGAGAAASADDRPARDARRDGDAGPAADDAPAPDAPSGPGPGAPPVAASDAPVGAGATRDPAAAAPVERIDVTARAADEAAGAATAAGPPAAGPTDPADPGAAPAAAPPLRRPSRIERLVAERMVRSRTEIPDFAVTAEIDMSAALAFRGDLKAVGRGAGRRVPSVNDLIVKASALALRDHPRVNSAWLPDGIAEPAHVHVGVAVATDDGGLVVPVVRDADRLALGELAARTRDMTGRARAGRIRPDELEGGTFTISNLGMLGAAHFTAIVTPGQGAILAIGATTERYVPVDGQPVLRPIMTVTLCSDHRVVYGAHAAAFLDRLRTILEHPGSLAL